MNTTDIQAMLDKQTEKVREQSLGSLCLCRLDYQCRACESRILLKTIDQYKRLMPWNQHSPECVVAMQLDSDRGCTCGLDSEHESIRKEIEG